MTTVTAPAWDARDYAAVSGLQQSLAARALAGLELNGDEQVLDVGCGDGRVSIGIAGRLPRGGLVGVDPSPSMVAAAAARAGSSRVRFVVGAAATLAYAGEFDLVVSFNALHWELRWETALTRMRQALRPGGRARLVLVGGGGRPGVEDMAMRVCGAGEWTGPFAGFPAPYVHVDPDAYAAAAAGAGFVVDRSEVADLSWDFGTRTRFAAWCAAGMTAWTGRLPPARRAAFVDDMLTAYAPIGGSDSTLRFRQHRLELGTRP